MGANKSHTQDVVSAVKAAFDPDGDVIMSPKKSDSTAVTSQDQVTPKRSIQINEENNVTTTYIKTTPSTKRNIANTSHLEVKPPGSSLKVSSFGSVKIKSEPSCQLDKEADLSTPCLRNRRPL